MKKSTKKVIQQMMKENFKSMSKKTKEKLIRCFKCDIHREKVLKKLLTRNFESCYNRYYKD